MTPDLKDPLGRFNPTACVATVAPGTKPTYYDCGICGEMHNALWDGDCRQDNARFCYDEIVEMHGMGGFDEIDMEDVDRWRSRNS